MSGAEISTHFSFVTMIGKIGMMVVVMDIAVMLMIILTPSSMIRNCNTFIENDNDDGVEGPVVISSPL